jgi:ubiquinone/menaquinone biosynthesis C-methylase UbiE
MASPRTFDQAARDYDEVRPGYPEELIEEVISVSGIPEGGRILEVGCGTGQATVPFARRGYRMLCLDVGGNLLALAEERCRAYPGAEFLNASFEEWEPGGETFDLLVSATAFHWIPPEIGFPKAARVLGDSGHIALFWNMHPRPFTGFFEEVQEVYRRVVPEWGDPRDEPSTEEVIRERRYQIDGSGLFGEVAVKRYPWSRIYDRDQYLRLLNTYSDHGGLAEPRRRTLFEGIGAVIEDMYGGEITRPYLSVLYIARKKGPTAPSRT